jgi:hypothetical protein
VDKLTLCGLLDVGFHHLRHDDVAVGVALHLCDVVLGVTNLHAGSMMVVEEKLKRGWAAFAASSTPVYDVRPAGRNDENSQTVRGTWGSAEMGLGVSVFWRR